MSASKVNEQIVDSISQCNALILDFAPSAASGMLLQSVAQALSNAAHNGTMAQQQLNVTAQTATSMGVGLIHQLGATAGKG